MNEPFHWTLLRHSQWLDWPLQQLYTNYSMVSKKDLKCTQNIQCLLSLLGLFLQVSYSLWFGWQFVDSTKKCTCKLVSWSWKILVSWSHEPHQNSCNVTVFNTNMNMSNVLYVQFFQWYFYRYVSVTLGFLLLLTAVCFLIDTLLAYREKADSIADILNIIQVGFDISSYSFPSWHFRSRYWIFNQGMWLLELYTK